VLFRSLKILILLPELPCCVLPLFRPPKHFVQAMPWDSIPFLERLAFGAFGPRLYASAGILSFGAGWRARLYAVFLHESVAHAVFS
jgi:hypothetical protein